MTRPVHSVAADAFAEDARDRMQRERIHHLVVLEGQDVIGVLSQRDTAGAIAGQRVGDLMNAHVITATPTTTMREAANLLRGHSIGCLPVLNRGRLVGIVTTTDLLDLIGRGAERPAKRWTLKHRGPRRHRPEPTRGGSR